MKTNDIKKGMMVRLRNGWDARIEDNKKGNIRLATVFGVYEEMGSIYAHDIVRVLVSEGDMEGHWDDVEHTEAQLKLRNRVRSFGG
jgi:hypothetical protein